MLLDRPSCPGAVARLRLEHLGHAAPLVSPELDEAAVPPLQELGRYRDPRGTRRSSQRRPYVPPLRPERRVATRSALGGGPRHPEVERTREASRPRPRGSRGPRSSALQIAHVGQRPGRLDVAQVCAQAARRFAGLCRTGSRADDLRRAGSRRDRCAERLRLARVHAGSHRREKTRRLIDPSTRERVNQRTPHDDAIRNRRNLGGLIRGGDTEPYRDRQ